MRRTVADLHIHTTRSDGAVEPDELPAVAADAGLEAVAITDHDRLPPITGPVRVVDDVRVIAGIELRVEADRAGRIDLLAYGLDRTSDLADRLAALQTNRVERATMMVDRLERELDVSVPIEPAPGVGRPHIAAAVASVTELSEQAVFDRYIGDGGPCYIARDIPSFDEGRRLLTEAGGLVVLAHPFRYDDPSAALELLDYLDGVEVAYPYDDGVDQSEIEGITADDTLVVTGGSDAHSVEAIGSCGLDVPHYRVVAEHLDIPMV